MKSLILIGALMLTAVSALAADYEVEQECKTDGVVVKATAKNVGEFSGASITLVCLDGRFAYARMDGLDEHNCLRVIARRNGNDTPVAVKTPEGEPLCPGKN